MNVKRRPLSHYKSLGRGNTLVVGPIDKEILGKDTSINKFERMMFEKVRMIE